MPMIRILTFSLSLYWAAFFACHAMSMLGFFGQGASMVPAVFDSGFPGLGHAIAARPLLSIVMVAPFVLTAALFLWVALSAILIRDDQGRQFRDISGQAFAGAGMTVTVTLLMAIANPSIALFQSIGLVVAGLAGSYAAVTAERWTGLREQSDDENRELARVMALNAAHTSLLARFTGQPASPGRGDR